MQALRPDGSVYPQRGQFGRYVAQRLPTPRRPAADASPPARSGSLFIRMVTTDGGLQLKADLLVLAIVIHRLRCRHKPWRHHPALIAKPGSAGRARCHRPARRVAVMGTAMADTVATLDRLGHRGSIVAFFAPWLVCAAP